MRAVSEFQSKQLRLADMTGQTAKGNGPKRQEPTNFANFFCWRQVVSAMLLITFVENLAPLLVRVTTALKAGRGRYPAGITVNRVIVLDERH